MSQGIVTVAFTEPKDPLVLNWNYYATEVDMFMRRYFIYIDVAAISGDTALIKVSHSNAHELGRITAYTPPESGGHWAAVLPSLWFRNS
jgi:hypothetical protein